MGKNNFTHLPLPLYGVLSDLYLYSLTNQLYLHPSLCSILCMPRRIKIYLHFLHSFTPLMPDMNYLLGLLFSFPSIFPSIHPPIHLGNHHLLSSLPRSNFISTFDGQVLCSESLSVSVRLPATTLFITVSSLPQALQVLWALPSYNDQMWLGP